MAHATLKLQPGVDTTKTPTLNEAALSSTNLTRLFPDRSGLGLIQKLGGWVPYYGTAISSKVRALKGWSDLNGNAKLAVGAEGELDVLANSSLNQVTPQTSTTNVTPIVQTSAGSSIITIFDTYAPSIFNFVRYITPISAGGLNLSGVYQVVGTGATSYTINAITPAVTTEVSSNTVAATALVTGTVYIINSVGTSNFALVGASSNTVGTYFKATGTTTGTGNVTTAVIPAFTTTSGSAQVTCLFNAHGYLQGSQFHVGASTAIGGITISGLYVVASVIDANSFTFYAANAASSAATVAMNSGQMRSLFYVGVGAQPTSTGFGAGGFGVGGFGTGQVPTTSTGTPITATDWSLDNWGQILLSNPAGGAIYYYDPSGTLQNSQILGDQCPIANDGIFVAMPQRQVVAWGSSFTPQTDPLLVRWSDVEDFTTWIGTSANQAGSYRIPAGSKIVSGIQAAQQGILWTDLDVWAMQYIGPPYVYGFNKIGSNCGAISRKCVGILSGTVYWMSQKQFFVMSGAGPQIMPCPVWDVVFQNLNETYIDHIRCAVNSQFNEVTWYYPSSASTGENDSYVKYSIETQQWDFGSLGRTAWIDQSVLGPPIGSGVSNYLYQHEIGNDAYTNGQLSPMLSSFQTGYFSVAEGDQMIFIDQVWPDMKWGFYGNNTSNASVQITFYSTNYPGDTPVKHGPYLMTKTGNDYITVRIRARLISIAVSSSDIGTWWRLGGIRYRFTPDGRY